MNITAVFQLVTAYTMKAFVTGQTFLGSFTEPPKEASSDNMFAKVFGNIAQWCRDFQLAGSITILVIGGLMIAIPLIIGTQQQKEQAKNRVFGFIIGTILLFGIFNFAAMAARAINFD